MRTLVLLLLLSFPFAAHAQQTIFVPTCSGVDDTAAFQSIITGAASNPRTVRIPYKADLSKRCKVNTLSVPSYITLDNTDGSGIFVVTGQTLTVVGPRVNPAGKTMFFNVAGGQGTVITSGGVSATTSGVLTASHCAQFDSNGNLVDAGLVCGGGGGGGLSPTRVTINPVPTYDLASGGLAVAQIIGFPNSLITVPADKNLSLIRISQASGQDNVFAVPAPGLGNVAVSGIYASLTSDSTSSATSNLYAGILHVTNAGPGNTKGLHAAAFASGSSSGVIVAGNFQIQGVATTDTGSSSIQISNTGADDVANGLSLIGSGSRFIYGVGTTVAPLAVQQAYYQAWMASASATNARAFQVRNNSGTEVGYIHKDGSGNFAGLTSPNLYGGTGASSTLTLSATSNGSPSNAHILLNPISSGVSPGFVFIGAPASSMVAGTTFTVNDVLHVQGPDSAANGATAIVIDSFGGTFGSFISRRANGTSASKTAVAANDALGALSARGYQTISNAYTGTVGQLAFFASENFTSTAQGTMAKVFTTANGSTTPSERMRITDAGHMWPGASYTSNIGDFTKKYLAIYASELDVETLVAQNTIATIGGRILVAPTTPLSADVAPSDVTITTKYNNLNNGDRILLNANNSIEFMAVTSGASGVAGSYIYSVTRDLDGTGANQWYAGDAVLDTGTTGNGFIDLYSIAGLIPGTTAGPTIVGNVRTGTVFNQIEPRWAIGNLNGLYDYNVTTYGAAFGVPTGAWLKVDPTNGVRIGFNGTTYTQIDASGNASFSGAITSTSGTIGGFSLGSDYIRDTANSMGLASTVTGGDDVRFWAGDTFANRATAAFHVTEAGALTATNATISGAITATSGSITGKLTMAGAGSAIAIGATPPTSASAGTGIWLDRNGLAGVLANVPQFLLDTTGLTLKTVTANDGISFLNFTFNGLLTATVYSGSTTTQFKGNSPDATTAHATAISSRNAANTYNAELLLETGQNASVLYSDAILHGANFTGLYVGAGSGGTPNAMLDVRGSAVVTSGLQVGAPTGGDKGAGTINVAGDIYKNNTAYTNPRWALQGYYAIADALGPYAAPKEYAGLLSLDQAETFVRTHYELPRMVLSPNGGLFERGNLLQASVEESYLYIFQLNDRIKALETKIADLEKKKGSQ